MPRRISVRPTASQTRTGTTKTLDDYTTDGKFAQFFETICQFLRDNVVKPQLGGMTDRYIPYIVHTIPPKMPIKYVILTF
jgi:hypothetical protein